MTAQITMLKTLAGPYGNADPGTVLKVGPRGDVTADLAKMWKETGVCRDYNEETDRRIVLVDGNRADRTKRGLRRGKDNYTGDNQQDRPMVTLDVPSKQAK